MKIEWVLVHEPGHINQIEEAVTAIPGNPSRYVWRIVADLSAVSFGLTTLTWEAGQPRWVALASFRSMTAAKNRTAKALTILGHFAQPPRSKPN